MRKKIVSYIVVSMLLFSAIGFIGVILIAQGNRNPFPEYKPFDIGPELRARDPSVKPLEDIQSSLSGGGGASLQQSAWNIWAYYDSGDPYGYNYAWFELRGVGEHVEVWVQEDLSWPAGDPRETPVITDENVQNIIEEFDSNIYPTDTDYFGEPDYHAGLNDAFGLGWWLEDTGRSVILISNVRDFSYYNSWYPYFVIGFYWGLFEYLFDRNIITLDAYNWDDYTGPDSGHPFAYEATTAHELQHLLHDDHNPEDDLFMNECCSVFAESLCGYGFPWNDINSYLATPDNSLVEWDDQANNDLADYGAVGLWGLYLNDHYGSDFLGNFVKAGIPGIVGLNAALYPKTFYEVYHDWRIANLIHWGDEIYNYESIDLNDKDVEQIRVYDVPKLPVPWMTGSDFGPTITILGYDTGMTTIKPFGTDYIRFDAGKYISKPWTETLNFDGDDTAVVGWQDIGGIWWSDNYDLMNTLMVGEAFVDPADPRLELTTYWDIEDFWDFGFVQVSLDGGLNWESLANEYTVDVHAGTHPDIYPNLPGLTGWSEEVLTITFDLTGTVYEDKTILFGFRYMTDWYTTYDGWYIFEARVSDEVLDLTVDYPDAAFQVSLVYELKGKNKWGSKYDVVDLELDELNDGQKTIEMTFPSYVYLVVSPIQPRGHADYSFQITTIHK
ncbi:MAG: immune inhibitor A [Candidatus Heimdallarchaeota archaeon]|nr:MAG: immune inhibitor A [Candidatus Heimdallarchaeota archaeon]